MSGVSCTYRPTRSVKSCSTPASSGRTGSANGGTSAVEAWRSRETAPPSTVRTASAPGMPPPARSSALFSETRRYRRGPSAPSMAGPSAVMRSAVRTTGRRSSVRATSVAYGSATSWCRAAGSTRASRASMSSNASAARATAGAAATSGARSTPPPAIVTLSPSTAPSTWVSDGRTTAARSSTVAAAAENARTSCPYTGRCAARDHSGPSVLARAVAVWGWTCARAASAVSTSPARRASSAAGTSSSARVSASRAARASRARSATQTTRSTASRIKPQPSHDAQCRRRRRPVWRGGRSARSVVVMTLSVGAGCWQDRCRRG